MASRSAAAIWAGSGVSSPRSTVIGSSLNSVPSCQRRIAPAGDRNQRRLEPVDAGFERIASTVAYRPCARCGRPHIPLPAAMTAEYLGGELIGPAAIETDYCEDCRQRMSSTRIRDAFLGPAPASEETRR